MQKRELAGPELFISLSFYNGEFKMLFRKSETGNFSVLSCHIVYLGEV